MSEGTGTGAGTGTGTGAPAPWYQGIEGVDDAMVGHIQTRGWDKLTPQQAAAAAAKAHREAESFIGVPADQVLKLPKDPADKEGWGKVWNRLGAPLDPKDYDFTGIKRADGTVLDEKFTTALRETFGALKLPKEQAAAVAAAFTKYTDNQNAAQTAELAAAIETAKAALKSNWAQNFDANMVVAKRAAQALGVDADTVASLEKVLGFDKVMEMFRSIGTKIGEDKFVQNPAPGSNGVMTREQAIARRDALKKDDAWVKAFLNGDAEKQREMTALNIMIVGDDTATMRGRGN